MNQHRQPPHTSSVNSAGDEDEGNAGHTMEVVSSRAQRKHTGESDLIDQA